MAEPEIKTPWIARDKVAYVNPRAATVPVGTGVSEEHAEPGGLTHPSEMASAGETEGMAGASSAIAAAQPAVDPKTGGLPQEQLDELVTIIDGVGYKIAHLNAAGIEYNVSPDGKLVTRYDGDNEQEAAKVAAQLKEAFPTPGRNVNR